MTQKRIYKNKIIQTGSPFQFLKDLNWNKWIILDPKRAKRPNASKKIVPHCPFCIGNEGAEKEMYRIGGNPGDSNWQVRVLKNKFAFAPIHEIVVHSPDHHKNIDELPDDQVEQIFESYRQRYNFHSRKSLPAGRQGQVYIFHNRGPESGESIPHPHSQLVVIPKEVTLEIRPLVKPPEGTITTSFYSIFCPDLAQWPDEVWVVPKRKSTQFGDIYEEELIDLGFVVKRLIQILSIRYGVHFPFNYYIRPGKNWYLRIIPRSKVLGAFEVGTNVWVNTEDPKNTMLFLRTHFDNPNPELIRREHMAEYRRNT